MKIYKGVILLVLSGCGQNWDDCEPTGEYQTREKSSWVQVNPPIKVGDITVPGQTIIHPAVEIREQRYQCWEDDTLQYKWREIERRRI